VFTGFSGACTMAPMNDLFPTSIVNGFDAKKTAAHYTPDGASSACLRCKTSFTLFFRRHHVSCLLISTA
jgi:hypothetical protein